MSAFRRFRVMPPAVAGCLLLVTSSACAFLAFPPADPEPAVRWDLVDGIQTQRLEIRIDVAGQDIDKVWSKSFRRLLEYFDRDGNGTLSPAEADRLPSPFGLRQILWAGIAPTHGGRAPAWKDLDHNGDGRVDLDELSAYYRRAGLGGPIVGTGQSALTDELNGALLRAVDADHDGKVTASEWKDAARSLSTLDRNDDELISATELVAHAVYPGATGVNLLTDVGAATFPIVPVGNSSVEQAKGSANIIWQVNIGTDSANGMQTKVRLAGTSTDLVQVSAQCGRTRLVLIPDSGTFRQLHVEAANRLSDGFREADQNQDGLLDKSEYGLPNRTEWKRLLALADRNNDSRLSIQELEAWLSLQSDLGQGLVYVKVIDCGFGLFELLDLNHDGVLSVRELRAAWDTLIAADCIKNGIFERSRLPRSLLATVSLGPPRQPLGTRARQGPVWFQAMDRNGDGDISRKEWIGKPELFDQLDSDHDGLLSLKEALQKKP